MFRNLICFIILAINAVSCAEFIEYPLEKENVDLLAPSEGYTATDSLVTFWWTTHEDAKSYRLQIVKPNFISPDQLVVDSIVLADKLSLKLGPGFYSWRVRPENNGSVGLFVERTFEIVIPKNEE